MEGNAPVTLMTILHPLVSFSRRRRKLASKSVRMSLRSVCCVLSEAPAPLSPGEVSSGLMSVITTVLPERVANTRRCLNCVMPLYLSIVRRGGVRGDQQRMRSENCVERRCGAPLYTGPSHAAQRKQHATSGTRR